ncbi:hypothetical protein LCGC14_0936250 [marine sediment metagenome]|uniref:Uncharacterized protein n=1 Tax=marine sediment metagenome TaxID=412755 RepID=A0A0F9R516_9ZZZZ
MIERIGGHEGLDVTRENGVIVKRGHNLENKHKTQFIDNIAALQNEERMLKVMTGSGFTPEVVTDTVVADGIATLVQTDIGVTEPMQDGEAFRRNCIHLLHEIRARGVRHGDLTGVNIVIRNNWPWAVDWQEGHMITEEAPQKQPYSDAYLLWRTVSGTLGLNGQFDTPRVARRWLAVLGSLGGCRWTAETRKLPLAGLRLFDLGCFQGDFVAAAHVEGMEAVGVDSGGFRPGENSIAAARELWPWIPPERFIRGNIMDVEKFNCDAVLLFSTWSYIVQDFKRRTAENLLGKILSECGVLFFENQLWGDGPGPNFFINEDDIQQLLESYGRPVEKLISIPVWGRPNSRTVWRVG